MYTRARKTGKWDKYKTYQRESPCGECKKAYKLAEIQHINNIIQTGLDENNSKPF